MILFTEYLVENYYPKYAVSEAWHINKEVAVRHIVQEILLVLIIAVVSIIVALFIAKSVQSEPLHIKDNQRHYESKEQSIIKGVDSENIRIIDVKLQKKL